MRNTLYVLIFLFIVNSLVAQKQNYAYNLSMDSYRNLYGKSEESIKLIDYFEKKQRGAAACLGISGGIFSVAAFTGSPFIAIPGLPILAIGLSKKVKFSKQTLYKYLNKEVEIPPKIKEQINK